MKRVNILKAVSFALALFSCVAVSAQGVKDLRFNEVLVNNASGLENEMGNKCGWVELRNSGYSTVDLGGCLFELVETDGNIVKCTIPKGNKSTIIAPQGFIVIGMDPSSDSPTTTSFTLENAKELRLYDASGKGDYLDRIVIDQNMVKADVSLSRPALTLKSKSERNVEADAKTRCPKLELISSQTPGYANYPAPAKTRAELFSEVDKSGVGMTVTAMAVVFCALTFLFLLFRQVGRIIQRVTRKKEGKPAPVRGVDVQEGDLTGDQLAAIAYALHLYGREMSEVESNVLTFNKVNRAYSPWSSKIHGLTRLPELKKR